MAGFWETLRGILASYEPQPIVQPVVVKAKAPAAAAVAPAVTASNPNALPVGPEAYADGVLDVSEVYAIAKWVRARHTEIWGADPYMAAVMATVESGGNSRKIVTWLSRYEPAFMKRYLAPKGITDTRRATSYGIMQTMLNTALEDYARGFTGYGKPTAERLRDPYVSIYFGMAHQVIVRRGLSAKGLPVTEKNIVMSYNGGIGANNESTQNHYAKYAANKSVVNSAIG